MLAQLIVHFVGFGVAIAVAVLGYFSARKRVGNVKADVHIVLKRVTEVHTLVNGQYQAQVDRVAVLERALADAGIAVPAGQQDTPNGTTQP